MRNLRKKTHPISRVGQAKHRKKQAHSVSHLSEGLAEHGPPPLVVCVPEVDVPRRLRDKGERCSNARTEESTRHVRARRLQACAEEPKRHRVGCGVGGVS